MFMYGDKVGMYYTLFIIIKFGRILLVILGKHYLINYNPEVEIIMYKKGLGLGIS